MGAARLGEIKEEARARRSYGPRFSSAPGDIRRGGLTPSSSGGWAAGFLQFGDLLEALDSRLRGNDGERSPGFPPPRE